MWFAILIAALTSYLLGNLNGSVCISALMQDDVRKHGSGNAGLTNFIRNYGTASAALVIAIDAGKAAIACGVGTKRLYGVEIGEQRTVTALVNVSVGHVEAAGVPRVGHVTAPSRRLHEAMHLALWVATDDAGQIADIIPIHAKEIVVGGIIRPCNLYRSLSLAGDAVLFQLTPCRGIDGVADTVPNLFGGCSGRGHREEVGHPSLGGLFAEYELRHGTAADVAVADKQDADHKYLTIVSY